MKKSYYNHIIYSGSFGYWFNSFTGAFFRLSLNLSKKIENLLDDLSTLEDCNRDFFVKLCDSGFIVNNDVDELDLVRRKHYEMVHSKDYKLVIIPTLNCNFSCWYCIQNHIPSLMNESTMESLKNHIDYMIYKKGITALNIEWFGGEPFMFFNKVIEPLSKFAIRKCAENNIPFTNNATTNGYFITPKVGRKLTELKFKGFQITLDGEKESHDKVKFMKGCSSAFEQVLDNINTILTLNPEVILSLRINYTHETLTAKIVDEVNALISVENRSRITVVPKKVWQEKVDRNFQANIIEILDLFETSGYKVERWELTRGFVPCYVNREYYNTINFNGNVVKCTACNDLYETEAKGVLKENGIIEWNDEFDKKCQEPTFENERCLVCKRLPSCMGLCPRDYQLGKTYCKYDASDFDFEKSLLDYLIHNCK